MAKKIVVIGGGTFEPVRAHLSLSAPAFGETAIAFSGIMMRTLSQLGDDTGVQLVLTKMADRESNLLTNDDVEKFVDELIADQDVRAIVFNVALCDFKGQIGDVPSGKKAKRLESREINEPIVLTPTDKIIGKIRKTRKDIFVVGFKTTAGASQDVMYAKAMRLLKSNSLNLVVANDIETYTNFIVAPEETRYEITHNRTTLLIVLAKMVASRIKNTFTRSTIVDGPAIDWNSEAVPENLREVVSFCIQEGAYKEVLGKTAGHFAVKVDDQTILTSIRKSNFNELQKVGLVKVTSRNKNEVIAQGFRPSVGGQSQRIVFSEHPELDCIVHFHCPLREDGVLKSWIATAEQWPNECGSHECGANTSRNLVPIQLGDGDSLEVVFLKDHGPNIVFNRKTPAHKIKQFIAQNFDLKAKTGGLAATHA